MTIALTDLPVDPLIEGLPPIESFLRVGDIRGDGASARHEKWVDVHSFSWDMARATTYRDGGGGRARSAATLSPLRVRCALDSSGPELFRAAAQGRAFPSATLESTSGFGPVILCYELVNVMVSSYSLSSVGTHPVQSFELSAERVTFTYRRIAPDGSTGGEVSHSWDVAAGR